MPAIVTLGSYRFLWHAKAVKQEALTRGEVFLCGRISKCKDRSRDFCSLCRRFFAVVPQDREQVRSEVDMLLSPLSLTRGRLRMGLRTTMLPGELQVDYVDLLVAECPPELAPRGLSGAVEGDQGVRESDQSGTEPPRGKCRLPGPG